MLNNVNDSLKDAEQLGRLLSGMQQQEQQQQQQQQQQITSLCRHRLSCQSHSVQSLARKVIDVLQRMCFTSIFMCITRGVNCVTCAAYKRVCDFEGHVCVTLTE